MGKPVPAWDKALKESSGTVGIARGGGLFPGVFGGATFIVVNRLDRHVYLKIRRILATNPSWEPTVGGGAL